MIRDMAAIQIAFAIENYANEERRKYLEQKYGYRLMLRYFVGLEIFSLEHELTASLPFIQERINHYTRLFAEQEKNQDNGIDPTYHNFG